MTQGSSHRRSPSSPHAPKSKASRPVLHRRGTSGFNRSISKLGAGQPRGPVKDDSDFDMAASFLNFWYVSGAYLGFLQGRSCPCMLAVIFGAAVRLVLKRQANPVPSAMCERQITVPNTSLLYCSERYVFLQLGPMDLTLEKKKKEKKDEERV